MNHIKTYESFVVESKEVGTLYHYTDLNSLEGILEEDRMESSAVLDYISFSRNPMLSTQDSDFEIKDVRITFDGDAMSDRFHIEPFMYDPEKDPTFTAPEHMDYQKRRLRFGAEREERIKQSEIKGIKKFITGVEIIHRKQDDFKSRLGKLEKENPTIDFDIVGSFSTHIKRLAA
jgi:hypothetical protein